MVGKTAVIASLTFVLSVFNAGLVSGAQILDSDEARDYIVVLHPDIVSRRSEHHNWLKRDVIMDSPIHGVKGEFHYDSELSGYHGTFSKRQIEMIVDSPEVAYVEKDSLERVQSTGDLNTDSMYIQDTAPWGLERISHKINTIRDYSDDSLDNSTYLFKGEAGAGTSIYILDTGALADHQEYKERFRWGANFCNELNADENGHGTHVTGVAAGTSVGVAKSANVIAVKILDAQQTGTLSNFLKAVDWIIQDAGNNSDVKSIINYSAVGEVSDARNQAIQKATEAGIFFVAAAGNNDQDACNFGPANMGPSFDGELVVAAVNYTDIPAQFTNYGQCVSVYAPGVSIRSSYYTGPQDYATMSGSSMSAPFVSGLVAYYWGLNPDFTHSEISELISNSNQGLVLNNHPGTVNKIAFNNA